MKCLKMVKVEDMPHPADVEEIPKELMAVYSVFQQMEIICDKENGIGLSAFQVGVPWKAFIIKAPGSRSIGSSLYRHFVNCEYTPVGDNKIKSMEGCLSLKSDDGVLKHFMVERWRTVRVVGQELVALHRGLFLEDVYEQIETTNQSVLGTVLQHEIDHQHGVLISDIGEEISFHVG